MGEFEPRAAEQGTGNREQGTEKLQEQVPRHSPSPGSEQAPGDDSGSQLSLWPEGEPAPTKEEQGSEAQIPRLASLARDDTAAEGEPAWTLTDLGAFVVFVVVVSLPAAFLGTAGVFLLLRRAFGWELTVREAFARAPLVVGMQTGWEVLWLGFIYFTVTVKYQRRFWKALRWRLAAKADQKLITRPRDWLAAGALLALAAQIYFYFSPTGKDLPIERLFTSPGAGYVLAVFGIAVAPFVEELVFRGFIYPVFERQWGFAAAVLLTALLFALIHASQLWGGWAELATIFLVGVAFSYTRGKTGSLAPSYLMHLGYNTALFVLLYLSTNGFQTLQG